ncbi:MAG TPA: hypothetical protein V6D10_17490 [Trichocoleus sp.]
MADAPKQRFITANTEKVKKLPEKDSLCDIAQKAEKLLKRTWAYRPGLGWYKWSKTYWSRKSLADFQSALITLMDNQHWFDRSIEPI